jgi:hypothetical protein
MKKIFVIVLLISAAFISNAQEIKVHRHVHSWVGGICCWGGSETTITIKIPKGNWQAFDSLAVCTGTEYRRYAYKDLAKTMNGDTLVVTAKYSYSYNEKNELYEIQSRVVPDPCGDALYLKKAYMRKELAITTESESMIAYP